MRLEDNSDILYKLAEELTTLTGRKINREEIFHALFILYEKECDLERGIDLWGIELNYEEFITRLTKFDFKAFNFAIELPDSLFPESLFMMKKVKLKAKGRIWFVYLNDPDPLPSNPHAHNLDDNIKLHLGTGDCYRRGKLIDKLGKKELLIIRTELEKRNVVPLPNLELD